MTHAAVVPILGQEGVALAVVRRRIVDGQPCDMTAAEWCTAWRATRDRLYPDYVTPASQVCYRCEGAGHYDGRPCEVCQLFGRLVERPAPSCQTCRGVGHVRRDVPLEHPQHGRAVECPDCHGARPRVTLDVDPRLALQQAHVPPGYQRYTLETLLDRDLTDSQRAAATAVAGWASLSAAWPAQHGGRRGIVLAGSVGVGKTGMAVGALAEAVRYADTQPRFASWLGLLSMLRQSWSHGTAGGMSQYDILDVYGRAEVLVLDDFGVTGRPGAQPEHAAELAEALWEARSGGGAGWTLVTTNLADWQAVEAEYGARVASRMRALCVWLTVAGPDLRQVAT